MEVEGSLLAGRRRNILVRMLAMSCLEFLIGKEIDNARNAQCLISKPQLNADDTNYGANKHSLGSRL